MKEAKNYVTVSTKLTEVDTIRLKMISNRLGFDNSSEFVREAVLEKMSSSHPSNIAGKNKIEYNPKNDSFSWKVELDNGEEHIIMENLSSEFIQDLSNSLSFELNKRNERIGRNGKRGVPIPRRLVK